MMFSCGGDGVEAMPIRFWYDVEMLVAWLWKDSATIWAWLLISVTWLWDMSAMMLTWLTARFEHVFKINLNVSVHILWRCCGLHGWCLREPDSQKASPKQRKTQTFCSNGAENSNIFLKWCLAGTHDLQDGHQSCGTFAGSWPSIYHFSKLGATWPIWETFLGPAGSQRAPKSIFSWYNIEKHEKSEKKGCPREVAETIWNF